jgi:hypothetical protein
MFVDPVMPFVAALLTAAGSFPASSGIYASRSCAELAALREQTDIGVTRLAEWMDRHCPGALEDAEPFCRFQSRTLLERLGDLGALKEAFAAKGCEPRQSQDAGVYGRASPVYFAAAPALDSGRARRISSFDDNWPWPRRPTFQAGLAASAGLRIRRCRADPECEW